MIRLGEQDESWEGNSEKKTGHLSLEKNQPEVDESLFPLFPEDVNNAKFSSPRENDQNMPCQVAFPLVSKNKVQKDLKDLQKDTWNIVTTVCGIRTGFCWIELWTSPMLIAHIFHPSHIFGRRSSKSEYWNKEISSNTIQSFKERGLTRSDWIDGDWQFYGGFEL